jgi:hypothetical protein
MPVHDWSLVPAAIFHHFHHEWNSTIAQSLNAGLLPSTYYALVEQIASALDPNIQSLAIGLPAPRAFADGRIAATVDEEECDVPDFVKVPTIQDALADDFAFTKRNRVVIRQIDGHRVGAMVDIVLHRDKSHQRALDCFLLDTYNLFDTGVPMLILDLIPPGPLDPNGTPGIISDKIFNEPFCLPAEQPLTLASYMAGSRRTIIEVVAIGESLPEMPLFLSSERYVNVPLEATYLAAWSAVPRRWQERLTTLASN